MDDELGVLLARRDDERDARTERVVEVAHAVPEPGCDMQVHDARFAGRARVPHGHRDGDVLVQ